MSAFDKPSAALGGNEKAPPVDANRGGGANQRRGWTVDDSTGNGRPAQGAEAIDVCTRDAWIAKRLLGELCEPSDLDVASPAFRLIAEKLAKASSEDKQRERDFYHWLDAQGEDFADAFEAAMRAVDPNSPPPAEDEPVEIGEPWPLLRLKEAPKAPAFPLRVLPPAVARLAFDGEGAIGCPADFIAVSALGLASGAIGRSASLLLKAHYFASASLYVAIVDPPGGGKTPALNLAAEPIRGIGAQFARDFKAAMEQWKKDCRAAGKGGEKPPAPMMRHFDIADTTTERLIGLLADNPRGLVMVRDELASLFAGMDQYRSGKGADRQFYCGVWSGATQQRDRIGKFQPESSRVDHPFLSIVGGMTPDLLGTIADAQGRADGLQDRFLFCYPEPRPVPDWSDEGVSQSVKDAWANIIDRLWLRPLAVSSEGLECPHTLHLSRDGRTAWRDLMNDHATEMRAEGFPYALRGPWSKLKEYAGRLALILALLRLAADPAANALDIPDVEARDVEGARELLAYFKSHARRALAYGGPLGDAGNALKAIVEWIKGNALTKFDERDIKQARRWIEDEPLAEALAHLAKRGAIRPLAVGPRPAKGGRPRSAAYEVNPSLLLTQNSQNSQNP